MYRKKMFFLFLIIILSSGCGGTSAENPIKLPEGSTISIPEVIPSPVPGKGTVIGQIEAANPKRLVGLLVYLGRVVAVEDKYGGFLDTNTAPVAFVDGESGKFYFADVEPGEYTLILYEVEVGGKVYLDSAGSAVLISVAPDKVLDLGTIQFMD